MAASPARSPERLRYDYRPILLGVRKSDYRPAGKCAAANRGSTIQKLCSTSRLRLPADSEHDNTLLVRHFLQFEFLVGVERLPGRVAVFRIGQPEGPKSSGYHPNLHSGPVPELRSRHSRPSKSTHCVARREDAVHAE